MKDSKKHAAAIGQTRAEVDDGAVEHMPRTADAKKASGAPKVSPDGLPRRSMFRDRRPDEAADQAP